MDERLPITANTKVGALLENYPQLETELLALSPVFAKLKNPVLRKTVARVATLRQAAEIAGLAPGEMVARLRRAAGMDDTAAAGSAPDDENSLSVAAGGSESPPAWFDPQAVAVVFDATPLLDAGASPLSSILSHAKMLHPGGIMKLLTPFVPAPVIGMLTAQGFECWSGRREGNSGEKIDTYIVRRAGPEKPG